MHEQTCRWKLDMVTNRRHHLGKKIAADPRGRPRCEIDNVYRELPRSW